MVEVAALACGVGGWRHWTGKLATCLAGFALALLIGVLTLVLILAVGAHQGRPL